MSETQDARIEAAAKEMGHYQCDDCWYSCPLSEEGCCNEDLPKECNCGLNARAARVVAAVEAARAAADDGPTPACPRCGSDEWKPARYNDGVPTGNRECVSCGHIATVAHWRADNGLTERLAEAAREVLHFIGATESNIDRKFAPYQQLFRVLALYDRQETSRD